MISQNYSFKEFIDFVHDKDYHEILNHAHSECSSAEGRSFSVRGAPKAREMGSTDYARALKAFIFFLNNFFRPAGATDEEFADYRRILEELVKKKQLKPSVLKRFE